MNDNKGKMKAKPFEGMKVLLVEDQIDMVVLLRNVLKHLGIKHVYHAPTGASALNFIDMGVEPVDVVLCDWNMPGMNGIEFFRQFRDNGHNMPFVMVSGRSDSLSIKEAKTSGVTAFISKPFSPEQLEAKLRAMTYNSSAS